MLLDNLKDHLQILAVVTGTYLLLTALGFWTREQVFIATCTAGIAFVIIPIFFRLGEGLWRDKLAEFGVHGISNLLIRNVLVISASWGVLFLSVKALETFPDLPDKSPTYIAGGPWHSGGTLHSASSDEWDQAAHANRLATSSDWVVAYIGQENAVQITDIGLRERSEAVVGCIDRKAESARELKPIQIGPNAVLCMLQMEFPRKND